MAKSLDLEGNFPGWRVKVRDKEIGHPPHVHIGFKAVEWRFGLRSKWFLDSRPDPKDVPKGLVEFLLKSFDTLVTLWDSMYEDNPVGGANDP